MQPSTKRLLSVAYCQYVLLQLNMFVSVVKMALQAMGKITDTYEK
jgi:hypothetical protein